MNIMGNTFQTSSNTRPFQEVQLWWSRLCGVRDRRRNKARRKAKTAHVTSCDPPSPLLNRSPIFLSASWIHLHSARAHLPWTVASSVCTAACTTRSSSSGRERSCGPPGGSGLWQQWLNVNHGPIMAHLIYFPSCEESNS